MVVCSPCNRKPLPVRLTDETSDPVLDIADTLVCRGFAQYTSGNLLTLVDLHAAGQLTH